MPRGRKAVLNYDEEISRVDLQIANCKNEIFELQEQRKSLTEQKQKSIMCELYEAVIASGKTPEECISMLSNQPQQREEQVSA